MYSWRNFYTTELTTYSQMRFYFDPKQPDVLQQLTINISNAQFYYGFEYLGVQERLVMTPLTDRYVQSYNSYRQNVSNVKKKV